MFCLCISIHLRPHRKYTCTECLGKVGCDTYMSVINTEAALYPYSVIGVYVNYILDLEHSSGMLALIRRVSGRNYEKIITPANDLDC